MSDKTKIEWSDATWNPVTGCTKVSEGCRHCYAATLAERFRGTPGHYFENGFDLTLRPDKLDQPLKWKRPRKIFVNSMSDLFHKDIPDYFIKQVFSIMGAAKQHSFQVLTKRPERMKEIVQSMINENDFATIEGEEVPLPYPNVLLGVSVEDQKSADERIPLLVQTPAAIRFLSCEPLLGEVNLRKWLPISNREAYEEAAGMGLDPMFFSFNNIDPNAIPKPNLQWIIAGGESGHGARPMHPEWARCLRDQCQDAGVSFFFKQWGEWLPVHPDRSSCSYSSPESKCATIDDTRFYQVGKHKAGRLLDGREWSEFPS